jgi:hypothetical protein
VYKNRRTAWTKSPPPQQPQQNNKLSGITAATSETTLLAKAAVGRVTNTLSGTCGLETLGEKTKGEEKLKESTEKGITG